MMALTVDSAPAEANRFETMRHAMVASQLRTNAVNDTRVVEAMARLPREDFLPEEHRAIAYRDTLLPLAGGRRQNLPLATGRLLTVADVRPTDKVLLIGAAGGYSAALLAGLANAVVAVEEEVSLATLARTALAAYANVELVEGPLEGGHAAGAPYDVLVVDGAVEVLPEALAMQLAPNGRIVTGLVERGVSRLATGRTVKGGFGLSAFADVDCIRLPGFARPAGFTF